MCIALQVFQDAKLLYYSLHGPHECTHGERQELLVDLARHSAALAEAERWNRMKVEEVLTLALLVFALPLPACGSGSLRLQKLGCRPAQILPAACMLASVA